MRASPQIANRASADVRRALRWGAARSMSPKCWCARPPSSHRLIFKVSEMTVAVLLICIRQINYQLLFAHRASQLHALRAGRPRAGKRDKWSSAQQFCHEWLFDIASEREAAPIDDNNCWSDNAHRQTRLSVCEPIAFVFSNHKHTIVASAAVMEVDRSLLINCQSRCCWCRSRDRAQTGRQCDCSRA
jgi:hypothetical protein